MPDPFATAGELAQYLQIAEPTDLGRWQQHLANASALIRGFCGQRLSQVAGDVITVQPTYSINLFLPQRPATAVTTVLEGVTPITTYTLISSSATLIRTDANWDAAVTVTYDHGYAEFSPEYESIKSVCLEVASRSITHNKDGTAEALGNTVMDAAGYAPDLFLTEGNKWVLSDFGMAGVG